VTSLSESSQGEVGDNREKWEDFWEKSMLLKIEHMVKLQVFGNNSKTVSNIKNLTWGKNGQHIKIYLPCNFEVNPITDHVAVTVSDKTAYSTGHQTFQPEGKLRRAYPSRTGI
jgi:hypothetical protein